MEFTKEARGEKGIYRDSQGKEINTYDETLDWIILVVLEPLRDFLDMKIDDEDNEPQKVLLIAQALLKSAEEKIYEAAEYIEKQHGTVKIVRAAYHQDVKPETMMDIIFEPAHDIINSNGKG